jgi:RNA polymerase sigma-70 factor, ECF subfamily
MNVVPGGAKPVPLRWVLALTAAAGLIVALDQLVVAARRSLVSVDLSEPGEDFARLADPYRRELLAHCYRMLGSFPDAEDVVQETLLRAWRGYDGFGGRSSLRTWLYRIATNACLTALQSRRRRVLPSGLGNATDDPADADLTRLDSVPWLGPAPTRTLGEDDPATIVALRDTTRLALLAAFQRLPPRQRAVLLLVEVVGYHPAEAAEFLGITTTAVRSLLQRARTALAADSSPDAAAGRRWTRRSCSGTWRRSRPPTPPPSPHC